MVRIFSTVSSSVPEVRKNNELQTHSEKTTAVAQTQKAVKDALTTTTYWQTAEAFKIINATVPQAEPPSLVQKHDWRT